MLDSSVALVYFFKNCLKPNNAVEKCKLKTFIPMESNISNRNSQTPSSIDSPEASIMYELFIYPHKFFLKTLFIQSCTLFTQKSIEQMKYTLVIKS